VNVCTFVVLGLVFPYEAKRLAWRRWPILCGVVRKTLINQSIEWERNNFGIAWVGKTEELSAEWRQRAVK